MGFQAGLQEDGGGDAETVAQGLDSADVEASFSVQHFGDNTLATHLGEVPLGEIVFFHQRFEREA